MQVDGGDDDEDGKHYITNYTRAGPVEDFGCLSRWDSLNVSVPTARSRPENPPSLLPLPSSHRSFHGRWMGALFE